LPTEAITRRLALIRYLYNLGFEQSKLPEPIGLVSILTFHDCIELFLQLASEHLNVSKPGIAFMDYWGPLESKLGKELSDRESLRRLNKARVDFKHHGILPSHLEIEGFRSSVTSFLETNTPLIFGIEFRSVSMLELIQCKGARSSLEESEKLMKDRKIEDAIGKTAVAFVQLVDDYEDRKRTQYGRSPFFFGESTAFLGSAFSQLRPLEDFADKVGRSIEEIQNALKLLSLGLDYRRYAKFRLLTPFAYRRYDGSYEIRPAGQDVSRQADYRFNDEWDFCFNFVIEVALHLQEFDFSTRE